MTGMERVSERVSERVKGYFCLLHGPAVMLLTNCYIRNKFCLNRRVKQHLKKSLNYLLQPGSFFFRPMV